MRPMDILRHSLPKSVSLIPILNGGAREKMPSLDPPPVTILLLSGLPHLLLHRILFEPRSVMHRGLTIEMPVDDPQPPGSFQNAEADSVPGNPFTCNICKRTYTRLEHLARHIRSR